MRYISLFSGIEAASVAWEPLGWEPVAFSEIEPFPNAVLAERYPNVPNLGDITKVDWSKYERRSRCRHRRKPVPVFQHCREARGAARGIKAHVRVYSSCS